MFVNLNMHNISICSTILCSLSLLGAVQLNIPANEKILNYVNIFFDWTQEAGAIYYNIQLSTDNQFDDIIFGLVEDRTIYIHPASLNWGSTYFWRVRPIYENDLYGEWSQVSSFHTGA